MAITRDDVEAGRVDLSAVVNGRRLPPVHPGEVLRDEFMAPLGLSRSALARALGIPARRIGDIVGGRRDVTAETALRLERYFGCTAAFWLNLQSRYALEIARRDYGRAIARAVTARAAGARRSLPLAALGADGRIARPRKAPR